MKSRSKRQRGKSGGERRERITEVVGDGIADANPGQTQSCFWEPPDERDVDEGCDLIAAAETSRSG